MPCATPQSSNCGHFSCDGFHIPLEILQNSFQLVSNKRGGGRERRGLPDLHPVLYRNRGTWDCKEVLDLTQHSAIAVCRVASSLPRTNQVPHDKHSGVFAPTSTVGKFTRMKCRAVKYFPCTFIHGHLKSFCFTKLCSFS